MFTLFGVLMLIFGGVAGIFLLRSAVGLWTSDVDEDTLRWLASGGILFGSLLIIVGQYF